ncbi:NmrA family NAD(P)-binding protein [Pseudarthrobacter sp. YAF2]|uniref:NmrA family NAD(P)-binding protein n=1 Tax=Pseudarthrobacter sp. YAF2 TaxID=3233078 RepID=UPI003F995530
MTITILGATGEYGRYVVENLLDLGVDVSSITATGRRLSSIQDLAERGVRLERVDYNDPDTLEPVINSGDRILMISGNELDRREAQHTAIIKRARDVNVSLLAYTSIIRATNTRLPVAPHHAVTERKIAETGLRYAMLRNGWYSENFLSQVVTASIMGSIVGSAGNGRIASATRYDYAAAAARVLSDPPGESRIYELAPAPGWTFSDLAAAATELLGREISYEDMTPEEHWKALMTSGAKGPLADIGRHTFRQRAFDEGGIEGVASFLVGIDADIRDGYLNSYSRDLDLLLGRKPLPLVDALRNPVLKALGVKPASTVKLQGGMN